MVPVHLGAAAPPPRPKTAWQVPCLRGGEGTVD